MMAVESSAAYLAGLLTEELAPEANAILSAPGNGVCFDCGAVDPEWVSIQHATVVCIGCAGEHRALGPALSHIRSLRFDTLSKNELAAMHAGGNAKLRAWIAAGQPGLSADVWWRLPVAARYLHPCAVLYRQRLLTAGLKQKPGASSPPPPPERGVEPVDRRRRPAVAARCRPAARQAAAEAAAEGGARRPLEPLSAAAQPRRARAEAPEAVQASQKWLQQQLRRRSMEPTAVDAAEKWLQQQGEGSYEALARRTARERQGRSKEPTAIEASQRWLADMLENEPPSPAPPTPLSAASAAALLERPAPASPPRPPPPPSPPSPARRTPSQTSPPAPPAAPPARRRCAAAPRGPPATRAGASLPPRSRRLRRGGRPAGTSARRRR